MTKVQYAVLEISLKAFEQADTSSAFEGRLSPGRYRVLEIKKNFPDKDTDYANLEVPSLGDGETWICTRWKQQRYAKIETVGYEPAPRVDFSSDPMAIDEDTLVKLLKDFHHFSYDLDEARYPWPLTGTNVPLAPPYTNNCCTFVEALVAKAWENEKNLQWSKEKHRQMMIFSSDDYFSPVTCLIESGMAKLLDDEHAPPAPWTVIQGWRTQWNKGHTFIILAHHLKSDKVLTLESNSSYKLNGVGYRMIGNLKDAPKPPNNWWEMENLWTWERMKSVYRYRKLAQLKVINTQWGKA